MKMQKKRERLLEINFVELITFERISFYIIAAFLSKNSFS